MRVLSILLACSLLAACATYEPPALHGAASMRVEVEVYKGPLTVSPAGQVGQLVAEVSDSVRAVNSWRYRAADAWAAECGDGVPNSRDCRQLFGAMSSARAILGASCYLLKSPTLIETVGRGVYIPLKTCGDLPPEVLTKLGRAEAELEAATRKAADKQAAFEAAQDRARADEHVADRARAAMATARRTAADLRLMAEDARLRSVQAAIAKANALAAETAAVKRAEDLATKYEAEFAAAAQSKAGDKALLELTAARRDAAIAAGRARDAEDEAVDASRAEAKLSADRTTAESLLPERETAYRLAISNADVSRSAVNQPAGEKAAAERVLAERKAAFDSAKSEAQASEAGSKSRQEDVKAQTYARLQRRHQALVSCNATARNSRDRDKCETAVTRLFGSGENTHLNETDRLDHQLAAFRSCLAQGQDPAKCGSGLRSDPDASPLSADQNFFEPKYEAALHRDISKCKEDNPDSIVEQLRCQGDIITVAFSNAATILTAAADRSSDGYVRGAPGDPEVRALLVEFGQISNEYGNRLSSRIIVLAKLMRDDGASDARNLPTSDYLRATEATDYLQLFDWLDASDERSVGGLRVGKLNVAERIRMAQRLASNENWQKVNEVYASGQGEVGMAFIKDELGNWNLKSFSNDPTELLAAYRNVASAALKTAVSLTAKAAAGPAGAAGARLSDAAKATSLATQLATGGAPATPGVVGGVNIAAMHQRTAAQLTALKDRYVKQEAALIRDVAAHETARSNAAAQTGRDRLTLEGRQKALADAELVRDSEGDKLQAALAIVRNREAAGEEVSADELRAVTSARTLYDSSQRSVIAIANEVRAAQGVVDDDVATERAAEAKKAAAAQRLADLSKDAVEALRATLDQYAGVIADLQGGVVAASPVPASPLAQVASTQGQ